MTPIQTNIGWPEFVLQKYDPIMQQQRLLYAVNSEVYIVSKVLQLCSLVLQVSVFQSIHLDSFS